MPSQTNPDDRNPEPRTSGDRAPEPLAGCFLRVLWLFGGIAGFLLLAAYIVRKGSAPFSLADAAFWAAAGIAIGARWLDVLRFRGTTADGRRATPKDARRYTLFVGGLALVVWGAAHALRTVL